LDISVAPTKQQCLNIWDVTQLQSVTTNSENAERVVDSLASGANDLTRRRANVDDGECITDLSGVVAIQLCGRNTTSAERTDIHLLTTDTFSRRDAVKLLL